jgi:hypothetical protein
MSHRLGYFVASLIAVAGFSAVTFVQSCTAQTSAGRPSGSTSGLVGGARQDGKEIEGQGNQMPHYKYDGAPGPAPRQDVSGVWGGPLSAPKADPVPAMTDWGKARFAANKSNQRIDVAVSNDPLNHCDPLGFPRNALWESRGISFVNAPGKVVELFQYEKVWREIWTDGRALPQGAGSDAANAPDSRYYGYSVGHWDGDYALVVDTVGIDERTWLDNSGHPHSDELHVSERYTRVDSHTLEMAVTLDDPKTYTKPWMAGTTIFKWIPRQEFEEQLCVPSLMEEYMKFVGGPAGGPGAK